MQEEGREYAKKSPLKGSLRSSVLALEKLLGKKLELALVALVKGGKALKQPLFIFLKRPCTALFIVGKACKVVKGDIIIFCKDNVLFKGDIRLAPLVFSIVVDRNADYFGNVLLSDVNIQNGKIMTITTSSSMIKFPYVQNADEFAQIANKLIEKYKNKSSLENKKVLQSEAAASNASAAAKIKDLKELLDSGLISHDEF